MNFVDAVKTCLTKYVNFEGRAGRPEFWWFALFQFIVSLVLGMFSQSLMSLASVLLLLPALGVGARRLHDIGKTGWLLLLWLIPVIGWLLLLYWAVQPSQPGSNPWGSGPSGPVVPVSDAGSPGAQ